MDEHYTKDKRYRILHYIQKDFSSYFESDTTWYWEVQDTSTKKILHLFVESDFENAGGRKQSGARLVKFSDDEESVIVEDHDGSVETIPLKTGEKKTLKEADKTSLS